jgi:pectinesterase
VLWAAGPAGAEIADPWDPAADRFMSGHQAATPDYVVDPSGPAAPNVVRDLQDAVDRALGARRRVYIALAPGLHPGPVHLPASAPPITLYGMGAPEAVELSAAVDAEMTGAEYAARFGGRFREAAPETRAIFERIAARPTISTANAAVLRVESDGFQARGITVRNAYGCDRAAAAGPGASRNAAGQFSEGQHQAVALHIAGATARISRTSGSGASRTRSISRLPGPGSRCGPISTAAGSRATSTSSSGRPRPSSGAASCVRSVRARRKAG